MYSCNSFICVFGLIWLCFCVQCQVGSDSSLCLCLPNFLAPILNCLPNCSWRKKHSDIRDWQLDYGGSSSSWTWLEMELFQTLLIWCLIQDEQSCVLPGHLDLWRRSSEGSLALKCVSLTFCDMRNPFLFSHTFCHHFRTSLFWETAAQSLAMNEATCSLSQEPSQYTEVGQAPPRLSLYPLAGAVSVSTG